MTRRAVWGIYLVLYLAFEGWAFSQLPGPHSFSITDGAYLLFLIGVGGLALNVRILTERFWRIVFGVSVLFLIHNWLVMPFVYFRSQGLGWNQVAIIQAFQSPALPIFLGLLIYPWRSPPIWRNAAQPGLQPTRLALRARPAAERRRLGCD